MDPRRSLNRFSISSVGRTQIYLDPLIVEQCLALPLEAAKRELRALCVLADAGCIHPSIGAEAKVAISTLPQQQSP
jgi:hypothetical protein